MHPLSLPRWMRPAPDSALADTLRLGRPVWLEAVHLLWTVWVFVVPMFTPRGYDLRWLGLTLLSYPVFLALYVAALLLPRRRVEACALGMIVLCMSLFAWYQPALTYFVFGCVMLGAGQERPLWVRLLQILLLSSVMLACARWAGYPWDTLAWLPVTTLVIGTLVHVERMEKRHAAELRLSHEEVRRLAALAERERIGRDLHDLLGHTLSLVALKSDLAARLVERDPLAARHEIAEVSQVAREALAQVRHAVTGIRAAGLAAELASARLLLESAGIVLACEHMENAVPLPPEIETVLAMSLREAVTNVQRHARASRVEASLACTVNEVVLDIRDDGTGRAGAPGNGLAGMRERVQALGGRMRIESVPGKGTGIRVTLPVPAAHLPVDDLSVRLSTPA